TIFHDDMDGWLRHRRIVPEARVPVNRSGKAIPQLVVSFRNRKNRDVVEDLPHAIDAADPRFEGGTLERHRHPALERDGATCDARADLVEDCELLVAPYGP